MSTSVARDSHIGPYEVSRQLGSGGMGEVYLAFDERLHRHIALKLLPSGVANDELMMNRLRREARMASSLNHPNIITIYDIAQTDGSVYVAMEYVDGKTLRELLEDGALAPKKALEIAVQIASGLAAAHRRDVVHRDLKPENVMVTADGVVKILDFGLAKSAAPSFADAATKSQFGTIAGTCSYMSPEQARGQAVDFRSDQFSFGSMLYELLSARKAFECESPVETLFTIVRDEPVPLSQLAPQVPAPLRWAIDRCMAKLPEDRYASTEDLARDLRDLRDHYSEASVHPVSVEPSARVRRRPVPFWATVSLLLGAGIASGVLLTNTLRKPEPPAITSFAHLTYSGVDYSPAVAPDRKTIAFSSFRDGRQRIWLKQLASGAEATLTEGPADDFPRFSPDGTAILFRSTSGLTNTLYRVPTVGGERRTLVTDATSGDWSPDGKRLAFTRNGTAPAPLGSLWVARADGSDAREVSRFPHTLVLYPRWSPDGTRIVLAGSGGRSVQSLHVVELATGQSETLPVPKNAGDVSSALWSTDGRSLFYARGNSVEVIVGSTATIYKHELSSNTVTPIAWCPSNATTLDRLGPGRMVFDSRSPTDNLREITLDGGAERWLTRGSSSDRQPAYAGDGSAIIFSSNRSGNLDLWQLAPATGMVRRVTDDAAEDWDPAFAPGGRILWSSGRSGNLEIWMAEADGTNARQISRDGLDAENPTSTPDGKWIVYNSFNPDKLGVWKIRSDGTGAVQLVRGRTALPEVSPDGQYVAYIADGRSPNASVRILRLSDGKDMGFRVPTRATRRTSAILGRPRWMPDSRSVAFLGQDEEGINGIFVQEFVPDRDTTSTRRKLGGFDTHHATESFGISPDGKRLTVAGWEQVFGLMTVNGLPWTEDL